MLRLFVDQLTVLDFSSLDPRVGLTGQSWIVDLAMGGSLDEQGMVQDFGLVKRLARDAVEAVADHRLVVARDDPGLTLEESGERLRIDYRFAGGRLEHGSPPEAVCVLPGPVVERAALEPVLVAAVGEVVPDNVTDIDVRLREEAIRGASYRYSHGLKAHDGPCQRIAHGHRSRIEIHRDGQRSPDLEAMWARRWEDIYLGSRDDVAAREDTPAGPVLHFAYTAREGRFDLRMPEGRCELLPAESTVERIADYIAGSLKASEPAARFRVRAFEGVNKGAEAER